MSFSDLGQVVEDENFPAVDLALRRGRHVHKDDERWYAFLTEAHPLLDGFYRRYGCELVQRSDGYFFLLPLGDELGKRHLSVAEMIVGQGLALAYLDPRSVEKGCVIGRDDLLGQLAAAMGVDALMRALNPKRKRVDERVMQRTVRQKVNEALRRLEQLGFVEQQEGDRLRLPASLMRFAEPVRGLEAPSEALAKLLERGEISLAPGDDGSSEEDGNAESDDALGEELAEDVDGDEPLEPAPSGAASAELEHEKAEPSQPEELAVSFDDLEWDEPNP
jgi:chromosome partition protein MukE